MTVPAPTEIGCVPWNVTDSATVAVLWAATGGRGVGDGEVDDEGEARWCGFGGLRCVSGLAWLVLGSIVQEERLFPICCVNFMERDSFFPVVIVDVMVFDYQEAFAESGRVPCLLRPIAVAPWVSSQLP